jgi:molybdenum cofactor synthesis domain-containing protein
MTDAARTKTPTAALLVIGDEILSGRTRDQNIAFVAATLTDLGIDLEEVRIVPDRVPTIAEAVRALSRAYDLVFTTGGIGPTHDDVTADAVAEAFGVPLSLDEQAVKLIAAYCDRIGVELNEARLRMARIPEGAALIANPISAAPGFVIGNVHVMAGVPAIMQAMMDELVPRLPVSARMLSEVVEPGRPEGEVAGALAAVQEAHGDVRIGSYPFHNGTRFVTRVVLRSRDAGALKAARVALEEALAAL